MVHTSPTLLFLSEQSLVPLVSVSGGHMTIESNDKEVLQSQHDFESD